MVVRARACISRASEASDSYEKVRPSAALKPSAAMKATSGLNDLNISSAKGPDVATVRCLTVPPSK
jgi:hypothetical protein